MDVHRFPAGEEQAFANSKSGLTALIRWLSAGPVTRIIFEPTGRYHRDLELRLSAAGYAPVKVNPRQAKRFSEALCVRAKTDRADAAMLARMGAALALEPQPVRPEILNELNELIAARSTLKNDRTAAKNRAKGLRLALLRRQNATRLARIGADLAAIDKAIAVLIASDPVLAEKRADLLSLPGISDITAPALVALAPELGDLDQRQIAALAGLAPIGRQSGTRSGRSFIRGGRSLLREALYMPALAAIRLNPDFRRIYARLTGNGKPAKVAITAVMQKLVILANALLRDKRNWSPKAP